MAGNAAKQRLRFVTDPTFHPERSGRVDEAAVWLTENCRPPLAEFRFPPPGPTLVIDRPRSRVARALLRWFGVNWKDADV